MNSTSAIRIIDADVARMREYMALAHRHQDRPSPDGAPVSHFRVPFYIDGALKELANLRRTFDSTRQRNVEWMSERQFQLHHFAWTRTAFKIAMRAVSLAGL